MIYRLSIRRLLHQLYQRRAEIDNLICFFERHGTRSARRRNRLKALPADGVLIRRSLKERTI